MGLRKRWAWEKIDWDERILLDQVAYKKSLVEELNSTELVEILNLRGIRAHRGLDREVLLELFYRSLNDEFPVITHPVDFLRRRIEWFMNTFWRRIKDQINPTCNRMCLTKPDMEVLVCYILSRETLEKQMREHDYRD